LIQEDFTPDRVAGEAMRVLTDPAYAASMRAALGDVRGRLGSPGASARAAAAVIEVARGRRRGSLE
jgi:lipid-A-disaccharide synthase